MIIDERQVKIDSEDRVRLLKYTWFIWSGYAYTQTKIHKRWKLISMHRLLMAAPDEKIVDHINRNKLDNRKKNLRFCSLSENCRNVGKKIYNTSGLQHIAKYGESWKVFIRTGPTTRYQKYFNTKKEAVAARAATLMTL